MVKCHGFALARYIEVNVYSLSLLSNPISIFIPSICRIFLAYMYSPLSGHVLRGKNWALFPYDQFTIHLLEVIPRQCSLRTLPSSDASAKPWVARPISVPQNLVNWHGAVGVLSKRYWTTWKQSRFFNRSLTKKLFWSFVGASKTFFHPWSYTFLVLKRSEPTWSTSNLTSFPAPSRKIHQDFTLQELCERLNGPMVIQKVGRWFVVLFSGPQFHWDEKMQILHKWI